MAKVQLNLSTVIHEDNEWEVFREFELECPRVGEYVYVGDSCQKVKEIYHRLCGTMEVYLEAMSLDDFCWAVIETEPDKWNFHRTPIVLGERNRREAFNELLKKYYNE